MPNAESAKGIESAKVMESGGAFDLGKYSVYAEAEWNLPREWNPKAPLTSAIPAFMLKQNPPREWNPVGNGIGQCL